jgi:hypothetical protein
MKITPTDFKTLKGLLHRIEKRPSMYIAEYVAEGCTHCSAPHGHFISCPTINRASAEAHSKRLAPPTEADIIVAHSLGIDLTR